MSDTPRTDEIFRKYTSDIDRLDALDDVSRQLEHELAAATARVAELNRICKFAEDTASDALARMATVERDALQRAADVCEVKGMEWQRQYIAAKENDHLLNGLSSGALSCRDEILALIPKERT